MLLIIVQINLYGFGMEFKALVVRREVFVGLYLSDCVSVSSVIADITMTLHSQGH